MTIQEIEQKLNECQKALAELKEGKKWKPKEDEIYWFRNSYCHIVSLRYVNSNEDIYRINNIPIFPTKEECKRYWHFMDIVKEKSYSFSKEEWEDIRINKHFIFYNYRNKELYIEEDTIGRDLDKIYFKTKEDAQYIIDNFKDELMEYWL